MGTRRDFVRQGGWALAGASVTLHAQDRTPAANPVARALSPAIVRTLLASAEAVTGVQPLHGHYAAYWEHQALNRPGVREVYGRFVETVAANAASAGIADFAVADLRVRAAILDGLRSLPDVVREFELPVFQEILAVFQRTDAWLQLGYAAWPGSARGLDEYRRAPTSIAPR
jgi:hypothetical protein